VIRSKTAILIGTARMGSDPDTSGADANNRAPEVANLFVADGSSLPASGGANPTRTLQAVALRSAEHIWIERATL